MIGRTLDTIEEADLLGLVSNSVIEGKTIEYKMALPGAAHEDKVKFLKAITSFANSAGGDLLYGVEADEGVPKAVPGLPGVNQDAEKLRLEGYLRDGVQERIRYVNLRFIQLKNGNAALLVRVPKSWSAPHRVTIGGHNHFYARNSAGSYTLDVPELRAAFLQAPTVAARMRAFREDRLAKIISGDTPKPLTDGGRMVVHLFPLQSFAGISTEDLELNRESRYSFSPPNMSSMSVDNNFDGYVGWYGGDKPCEVYVQLFRSGIVELVQALHHPNQQGSMRVSGSWVEQDLHYVLNTYVPALQTLGVPPPYYLGLSLLRISQHDFDTGRYYSRAPGQRAGRDDLIFPEMVVDSGVTVPVALRSLSNRLWNAFGHEGSPSYDAQGNFVRKKWD